MDAFKVGLFALSSIGAVIFMSFQITMNQSGFGDYVTYRTIVRDASGIFPKTPIRVAGINAGRIKDIELVGNNAVITFEVLEQVTVTEDSVLRIRTVGLLGDKFLEIVIGESRERLDPGGMIVSVEGEGVEHLMAGAADILKEIKVMAEDIRRTLTPEGRPSPLEQILSNVEAVTSEARSFMEDLSQLVGQNNERLNKMIVDLGDIANHVKSETDPHNSESSLSEVKRILAHLEATTRDFQALAADIKSGKGTVGKLLVEEEIADEVRQTLAGVQKIVNRAEAIRTELDMFSGANTDYGAETHVGFRIFPAPERFYYLGVTTSEFGPEKETITSTVINDGPEERIVRKEKTKNQWRFDIQLGRRIQNWTLRGGVIESSGGFGIDYDLRAWNQRFTLEAYDYRDDEGVNLRARTDLQFWNVLYGRLAGEDLVNNTRSLTISAGLKFTDEDLKGLLAFFL